MKILANDNVFSTIKNAIDKEAQITMLNMQLMEKMDYLLAWSITTIAKEVLKRFDEVLSDMNSDYDEKSIIRTIVEEVLENKYGKVIAESDIDKLTQNARILPKKFFEENAYLNNIKLEDLNFNDTLKMTVSTYNKYQISLYNGDERRNLVFYPRWGFMQCDAISYIMMNGQNNKAIVALIPSEMFQMQTYIDTASGKVLQLGLKIGYFTYLAGIKEDVTQITVIEPNQDLIDYFNQYILPQFDPATKNKITVIKCDPIEYIKYLPDGGYDYCFVNLWSKPNESELYFKLKRFHNKFKNMKIDYYKELQLVIDLYEVVALNIYFALQKKNGITPQEDSFVNTYSHDLEVFKLEIVEELFHDYKITELQDLLNLYSFKFILSKINEIKCEE